MISAATDIPGSSLLTAMNEAFSDYPIPMQMSQEVFALMLRIRGFTAEHSRLAWVDDQIAAFWFVSVRDARAYLMSSGTLPIYRRKGLSKALGQTVIAHLAYRGVKSLQSEVLENNHSARALYRELGFSEHRELVSFSVDSAFSCTTSKEAIEVAPIPTNAVAHVLWDSTPSWQNNLESLTAAAEDAICFAIRDENGLAAYAAFTPQNATLAQLAVRTDKRRSGLATTLLNYGRSTLGLQKLKIINVDRADTGASAFLKAYGAEPLIYQRELLLTF